MDQEKIGNFIKKLRLDYNMSQKDLAEKIPIGRDAISKWENGKTIPDAQNLIILSQIFNVSIDELMLGEFITKDNVNKSEQVHLEIYDDRNNIKKELKNRTKILLGTLFLLLVSIISFLGYYFFNSYDSVKIYTIESEEKGINLSNGFLVMTGENIYFRLGNISGIDESSISRVSVYWKLNGKKNLVYESDSTIDGLIRDYYGYEEYFVIDNKRLLLDSLFVDITIDGNIKTIKLKMTEDYANKRFFFNHSKKITNNTKNDNNVNEMEVSSFNNSLINIMKENDNNMQINYNGQKYDVAYFGDSDMLTISWEDKNIYYSFVHYFNSDLTLYNATNSTYQTIEDCSFNDNDNSCDNDTKELYEVIISELENMKSAYLNCTPKFGQINKKPFFELYPKIRTN